MRRTVQAAVGLLGLSLAAVPAAARDAGSWGGEGGGPFRKVCGPGEAWFAYQAKAGKALNAVNVICQNILPDKTTSGSRRLGSAGLIRDGDQLDRNCPPNSVITGLLVGVDGNRVVSKFDITCTNLQTRATSVQRGRTEGTVRVNYPVKCAPDEVAVGAYGREGALIDQLGLICEKLAVVQPALAAQPASPPRNPTEGKPAVKTTGQKGGTTFGACYNPSVALAKLAVEASRLGNCPVRWSTSVDDNVKRCVVMPDPASTIQAELAEAQAAVAKCKGGGGQKTTTVKQDVDLYASPPPLNQEQKGTPRANGLKKGQTVGFVSCRSDNWCQVTGGWVFGDFITK